MSVAKRVREVRAEYWLAEEPALLRGFELLATAEGGVAALRELVLTLALHGKMVGQFGSDEPAEILLSRIRSSPPNKPHVTNFTSERPFEVPSSWVWATLGEVIDVVRGITFPANQKTREPASDRIACLRTANVQSDVEWDDLLFVDRSFVKREEQIIQYLDIVMSMANSKALVGKVALVEDIPWPEATIGGFLSVLRPRLIDARYVMIVMRSRYARSALIDSASQTTNIANISLAKLRPLPFPLPPLAEQHRIVARVKELMTLCDELETHDRLADEQHARLTTTLFDAVTASDSAKTLATNWQRIATHFDLLLDRPQAIDALEQTILQLAVRGLLAPQDASDEPAPDLLMRVFAAIEDWSASSKSKPDKPQRLVENGEMPFELPAGWLWTKFEQTWESSFYGPRFAAGDYVATGGLPTIRTTDMSNGRITLKDAPCVDVPEAKRELYLVKRGDLLVTRSGSIGVMALFDLDVDAIPSAYLIRLRFNDAVAPAFAHLFLTSPMGAELMGLHTTSVGVPNVSASKMAQFPIPLPPLAEQHRIVARVEQLRRLCDDLRERLNKVRATQTDVAEALVTEAVQPQRGVRLG